MKDYYFDEFEIYKKFKKSKSISLYKAFIVKNHDEPLNVNTIGDYYSITPEDAIKFMLSQIEFGQYLVSDASKAIQDEEIAVICFDIDMKCLEDIPAMKNMETAPYEKNNTIEFCIHDKKWNMKIDIYHIHDINVDINEAGHITKFIELKLIKGK